MATHFPIPNNYPSIFIFPNHNKLPLTSVIFLYFFLALALCSPSSLNPLAPLLFPRFTSHNNPPLASLRLISQAGIEMGPNYRRIKMRARARLGLPEIADTMDEDGDGYGSSQSSLGHTGDSNSQAQDDVDTVVQRPQSYLDDQVGQATSHQEVRRPRIDGIMHLSVWHHLIFTSLLGRCRRQWPRVPRAASFCRRVDHHATIGKFSSSFALFPPAISTAITLPSTLVSPLSSPPRRPENTRASQPAATCTQELVDPFAAGYPGCCVLGGAAGNHQGSGPLACPLEPNSSISP